MCLPPTIINDFSLGYSLEVDPNPIEFINARLLCMPIEKYINKINNEHMRN